MARLGDRSGFSRLKTVAYFNHAASGPPSDAVCERVMTVVHDFAAHGAAAFMTWHAQRERLRAKLASLIAASPDELAFVPNTTIGLTAVAQSLPWKAGQRIVVFDGEFPSNVSPYQRLARAHGLSLVFVPAADMAAPGGPDFTRLDRALAGGVRLVAVSAVQFQTGLRMPLSAIAKRAHQAGAEVLVDAIQGLGAVPLSVHDGDLDYLACGSHKWLMGPMGAGFVYVARRHRAALDPAIVGCWSHRDALDLFMRGPGQLDYGRPLLPAPAAFEGGTLNASGFAGLEAAVDPILSLGVDAIHAHVGTLLDRVEDGLTARGFTSLRAPDAARRSCILALEPPDGQAAQALVRALQPRRIAVSCPDGKLRVAPHWHNHPSEVDHMLAAIDDVLD